MPTTKSAQTPTDSVEFRVGEARKAHDRSWPLTPLAGKRPTLKKWQELPAPDLTTVEHWATVGNIGLRTGARVGHRRHRRRHDRRISGRIAFAPDDDHRRDRQRKTPLLLPATGRRTRQLRESTRQGGRCPRRRWPGRLRRIAPPDDKPPLRLGRGSISGRRRLGGTSGCGRTTTSRWRLLDIDDCRRLLRSGPSAGSTIRPLGSRRNSERRAQQSRVQPRTARGRERARRRDRRTRADGCRNERRTDRA